MINQNKNCLDLVYLYMYKYKFTSVQNRFIKTIDLKALNSVGK